MARSRKRHVQLELPKLDKNGQRRGGKRAGAGRPRKDGTTGGRKRAPHTRRAKVRATQPQHVVLRTVATMPWLRGPKAYRAVRRALGVVLDKHHDFRIVHFSVQSDHLHLLCEAENEKALARGVRAFEISAAKNLNRELAPRGATRRRGQVFADRYHVETITTVAGTRHALNYVLNNWRKHRHDRGAVGLYEGRIDPFSSGIWFAGWKDRTQTTIEVPPGYEPPRVSRAQSWLLSTGYRLAAPISCFDVPGSRRH